MFASWANVKKKKKTHFIFTSVGNMGKLDKSGDQYVFSNDFHLLN